MEQHEVALVKVLEENIYKGQKVQYEAVYEYCEFADEYFASETLISQNDIAMKNAYRKVMQLLTTDEIANIRKKYSISQADLASLLGWGGKTITRYEGHQVQDVAHDTILRKLDSDPEWFLHLLEQERGDFQTITYERYRDKAVELFEKYQDVYLRKTIEAQYAKFNGSISYCGGIRLNINKVIEVMRYFANSQDVSNLFKVKMMKLLWYVDALSFKRRGVSLTGLAYTALPMGAVPVAHKLIMDLQGVEYEEVDFGDAVGYKFVRTVEKKQEYLTDEDIAIIEDVIRICGKDTKEQIVQRMHSEKAYRETVPGEIIKYQYAVELSVD